MPLGDFIPHTADILADCGGTVYLQKKKRLWRRQNRFEWPSKLNRSKAKLKFFYLAGIAARALIARKDILRRYASKHHRRYGRAETQEVIEMIALRLVAKNPGAATWENFLRNQR